MATDFQALEEKWVARDSRVGSARVILPWGRKAFEQASGYINANYGYNPELAARRLRGIPTTADAVEEAIKRQADMGVDEFILRPCAEDLDQMDRLAELAAKPRRREHEVSAQRFANELSRVTET